MLAYNLSIPSWYLTKMKSNRCLVWLVVNMNPANFQILGCWLGPSYNIGDVTCSQIPAMNGQMVSCTTYSLLSSADLNSEQVQLQSPAAQTFCLNSPCANHFAPSEIANNKSKILWASDFDFKKTHVQSILFDINLGTSNSLQSLQVRKHFVGIQILFKDEGI
jgi:hypothetical protein